MKKIPFLLMALLLIAAAFAPSDPHTTTQKEFIGNRDELRVQMNAMLISMSQLDILASRDKMFENAINKQQAEQILEGVSNIRKLDTTNAFKPNLDELERLAKDLLEAAKKNDPKTEELSEQIFNTCFSCHQMKRETVKPTDMRR